MKTSFTVNFIRSPGSPSMRRVQLVWELSNPCVKYMKKKKNQTFCKWQKRTLYIYLLSTYSRSLHTSTSSTTTSSTMICYYRKISVQYRVSYAYEQDKYTGRKQATTQLNLGVIIDKNALMVTQVNRKYRKYYGIIGMGKSRRGNN